MTLAMFAVIAWIVVSVFSLIPKSLSTIENIIVFFLLLMCATMSATILSLNMGRFRPNDQLSLFFCFWLQRTVIIPASLLICINTVFRAMVVWRKLAVVAAIFVFLFLVESLAQTSGVLTFQNWNRYYFLAVMSVLLAVNLLLAKGIKKLPAGN